MLFETDIIGLFPSTSFHNIFTDVIWNRHHQLVSKWKCYCQLVVKRNHMLHIPRGKSNSLSRRFQRVWWKCYKTQMIVWFGGQWLSMPVMDTAHQIKNVDIRCESCDINKISKLNKYYKEIDIYRNTSHFGRTYLTTQWIVINQRILLHLPAWLAQNNLQDGTCWHVLWIDQLYISVPFLPMFTVSCPVHPISLIVVWLLITLDWGRHWSYILE